MFNKKVSAPTGLDVRTVDKLIVGGVEMAELGGQLYGLNKTSDISAKDLVFIDSSVDLQAMLSTYHFEHGKKYKYLVMVCCADAVHRDNDDTQKVRTVFLANKAGTTVCIRFERDWDKQNVMRGVDMHNGFAESLERALS